VKLIYIAAPYSQGDPIINIRNAVMAADKLLELGYLPFIPHLTGFWHLLSPKPYKTWMAIDREMLRRCDAVLRLDGLSPGADKEVVFAEELGLNVYYSIEELSKWLEV